LVGCVFEPETVSFQGDNFGMVHDPVEQGGVGVVAEDFTQIDEGKVAGQDQGGRGFPAGNFLTENRGQILFMGPANFPSDRAKSLRVGEQPWGF